MRIAFVSGTMGRLAACVEVASILLMSSAALAAPQLVLVNAKVFTADPALPYAQAVAIEDGRILAVGSNEQVRALTGPNTRILDAGGRLVTPGLIEGHVHLGVALPTPPIAMPNLPFPGPNAEQALAAVELDYVALMGVALMLGHAAWLAWSRRWNANVAAIYVFALALIFLGSRSVWEDAFGYGRVISPLIVLLAAEDGRPRLAFLPVVLIDARIGLNFLKQIIGVARGLAGL